MKRIFQSAILSILLLFHALPALAVSVPPPLTWKPGAVGFLLSSEYFTSNANYEDARGSFRRLLTDNSVSSFENSARGMFALSSAWYAFGGFGFGLARVLEPSIEKSTTNLSDINGGSYFLAWDKWLRIIPEVSFSFPLSKISRGQTSAPISDGVMFLQTKIHMFKPTRVVNVLGHLGLHWPFEGLSKKLLYEIGVEKPFGTNFAAGLGIGGYETILADDQSLIDRQATNISSMGGSGRFYAFGPSLAELKLWLGFSPERTYRIRFGYAKTINGVRAAEGQSVFASMQFNFKSAQDSRPAAGSSSKETPANQPANITEEEEFPSADARKKFKVNQEETNPELFKGATKYIPAKPGDTLDATEKLLEEENKKK
jgi:hypothetical protein